MQFLLRSLLLATLTLTPSLVTVGAPGMPMAQAQTTNPRLEAAQKLLQRGVEQYSANQIKAAEDSLLQALAIYREEKDRAGEWFALYFLGTINSSVRNFAKGQEFFQQSLSLAQALGDRGKLADSLIGLGRLTTNTGEFVRAVGFYQQGLEAARAIGDRDRTQKALEGLILVYETTGDSAGMQKYRQQQEALAQATPDSPPDRQTQIMQLLKQAEQESDRGNKPALEAAAQLYKQAQTLAQQSQAGMLESLALLGLASTYSQLGQKRQAIAYSRQILQILPGTGSPNPLLEVATLLALGKDHSDLGEKQLALDFYAKALKLQRPLGDKVSESTILNNIGMVYLDLGDYRQGIDYLNQSLALAQAANDRGKVGKTLNNIGLIYTSLGAYQRAIDQFEQALPLFRALKQPFDEAVTLNNLGTVYGYLGQRQKSLKYFEQALDQLETIGDRAEQAATLTNLGWVYSDRDSPRAIAYYQQALALVEQVGDPLRQASILGNLGLEYATSGNYSQAEQAFSRSLKLTQEVGDRAQEALALARLGQIAYARKDYLRAESQLQQALGLIQPLGDRRSAGFIHLLLGKVQLAANQPKAAETSLQKGIQTWETIRADLGTNDANKISLFDQQERAYRLLQLAQLAQNRPEVALETAERGRARAFVELLAGRLTATPQASIAAPNIEQIRRIAQTQNATLVEYAILENDLLPFQPHQPQPSTLLIWVIAPSGQVTLRQVDLSFLQAENRSLEDLLVEVRQALGLRGLGLVSTNLARAPETPSSPTVNQQLQRLHQLLIQPIADLLPSNPDDRVIFLPQRELFFVPFAALQDRSGKYLIESHTILSAPSIQVLDLTQRQAQRPRQTATNALVVGNPTMPRVALAAGEPPEQLAPLPGAEQEARAIAQLLQTQAITGNQATKARILQQMPTAGVIHLATHGLIDDLKGLGVPGAIALAPSGSDSGLLTADEILNLQLQAELVVLSACDTGRGRITGDGVIGLSRSFLSAGVSSLVVSLWAVPDAPTAVLMTEFYRQLQQQPDRAKALRQAMLTTLGQYPNPRDWAAFTLIGASQQP